MKYNTFISFNPLSLCFTNNTTHLHLHLQYIHTYKQMKYNSIISFVVIITKLQKYISLEICDTLRFFSTQRLSGVRGSFERFFHKDFTCEIFSTFSELLSPVPTYVREGTFDAGKVKVVRRLICTQENGVQLPVPASSAREAMY